MSTIPDFLPPEGSVHEVHLMRFDPEHRDTTTVRVETRTIAHLQNSKVMAAVMAIPFPEKMLDVRVTADESGQLLVVAHHLVEVDPEDETSPIYSDVTAWALDDTYWSPIEVRSV